MRQWRVGSFSMGILLITLGIILLFSIWKDMVFIGGILKLWPIILLILGIEVLGSLYFSKEANPKIEYDLFSIFMTIMIIVFSMGVYTLTSIGILPIISNVVNSENYEVKLAQEIIHIDDKIEKIVINSAACGLELGTTHDKNVIVTGRGKALATSQKEANGYVKQSGVIKNQVGNILYLDIVELPRAHNLKLGIKDFQYRIFVPNEKQVEIKKSGYYDRSMDISVKDIENNWVITSNGEVRLNIHEGEDIAVEAITDMQNELKGNIEWERIEDTEKEQIKGKKIIGEGKYKLQVFGNGKIEANIIR
ncbi:hypothetical protein HNQ80_001782 [Anaerosolibacter carboniphilus]|uniref:DUF5668 domain-containing protein n=1 Tax=Anaerosolibacter carboniphilus TaxID=1417629 RepID=A0A841KQJ7_9FIRM|nr:hypothetical protein [Anaerosolibacter carboniphilus]MBB6215693.1 hypothetical protein [Anaerosolibacter carboniphilus]